MLKTVKDYESPIFQLRNKLLDIHRNNQDFILGKLLTLADATFADLEQRKAFKDLIKQAMYGNRLDYEMREIVIQFADAFLPNDPACKKENRDGFEGIGVPSRSTANIFINN